MKKKKDKKSFQIGGQFEEKKNLLLERTKKRDSVRNILQEKYQDPVDFEKINNGMLNYYKTEPYNLKYLKEKPIEDNSGQWKHPGKVTKIGSNKITMKDVPYPVLGISDTGDKKLMMPEQDYLFDGNNVTEYPMAKSGKKLKKKQLGGQLGQLAGEQNYAKKLYGKVGGINGIAQGAIALGGALKGGNEEDGPSVAQKAVGSFGPWGAAISQVSQIGTRITDASDNAIVGTLGTTVFDPASVWTNKDLSKKDRILGGLMPIYGGYKAFQARQNKKKQGRELEALMKQASELQDPDADKRRYVRPEDELLDPNSVSPSYGTGTNYLKNGGKLKKYELGGEVSTQWGGEAEIVSENPYLPDGGQTIMFNGNKHSESDGNGNKGIGAKFGKSAVEVEDGEPAVKLRDGEDTNVTIFGDMKIPLFGVTELNDPSAKNKKFKNYVKDLNEQEVKQNKIMNESLDVINNEKVSTPYDKLKFSSAKMMMKGSDMKLKHIAYKKEMAAGIQNAILETAEDHNLKSDALAKGKIEKAKHGKKIAQYGGNIRRDKVQEFLDTNPGWELNPEDENQLRKYTEGANAWNVDYSNRSPKGQLFDTAFGNARKLGLDEFQFQGGRYGTEMGTAQYSQTPGKWDYRGIYDPNEDWKKPIDIKKPTFNYIPKTSQTVEQETPEKKQFPFDWRDGVNAALHYLRPSNQTKLDPNQLSGEMYALANNQVEPVQAQLYQPLLEQATDISLQDQMNANQSDFNALARQTEYNPAAQSVLAGQKYSANSGVLGEQFRQNQNRKMSVYNGNRQVLNDATLKNLAILDQQYVSQSQAKSNTKAVAQAAISSIADKIAKHKLENRTLGIYENLYNYRFDGKGRAINMNGFAKVNTQGENLPVVDNSGREITTENIQDRDKYGNIKGSKTKTKVRKKAENGSLVKYTKYF